MKSSVVQLPVASQFLDDLKANPPANLGDKRLFINRELGHIRFIDRVLDQSTDKHVPLLERLRFLSISNLLLDEFFEVRVAALKQKIKHGIARPGPDGMAPTATLEQIHEDVKNLVQKQYGILNDIVSPALVNEQIRFIKADKWTQRQRRWLHQHFQLELMPVLSPLGLDPVHPFPRILTKSLNFAVELQGKDAFGREGSMALVRAPRSLPRVIRIPSSHTTGPHDFVLLSSVLQTFMPELFPGMEVIGCHMFRVTRDSELLVDEEEVEDLANALQTELVERGFAAAVRLETTLGCPPQIEKFLAGRFELSTSDIYQCDGPVNLNRLAEAFSQVDRPDLKFPVFTAGIQNQLVGNPDLFSVIAGKDVLLHHPYENFQTVIDFLRLASRDPNVLAIKQTLYRTGIDSHMVNLLVEAARAGKDVTVVVELRARFDEAANISLASRLQEAGVQVVYGIVGHKAHAKMLMVVRRERNRLYRYVHLGTGNYHSGTANHYTDLGLLTSNTEICEDVHRVFMQLSGLGRLLKMTHLLNSPFTLHKHIINKIKQEAGNAAEGKLSGIDAKMNALTDPKVIRALYAASRAGVPIRLQVRGACRLRPGIDGVSENIRVRSVIGRFLEHARVYRFENAGEPEIFCSSADWMERNLYQRVEVAFPILDEDIHDRIHKEIFAIPWQDEMQGWDLQADGKYVESSVADGCKQKHPQRRLLKMHRQ
jgi:polyphosphate kinase